MAGRFSVEAVFKAVDRITAPVSRMQNRVGKFTRSMRSNFTRLNRSVSNFTAGIKRGAVVMAAALAIGTGAMANVVAAGAEFEQAITNVGAVSLRTRAEIAPLEKMALDLGRTTKFTSAQAANAMEVLARAGFSTNEILAATPAVLNAAAASGLEIAEVADHVSNALKGMGLETTQAAMVADVLTLASSKTNSSIGSLGESIRNVASTARQLNIPLNEVTAAVALLQDVGLDASVAGSAFNTMLTKMAAPTTAIQKKMKRFGITFKDAQGNMLPFQKVLQQLSVASKKAGGNFDKVAFLAELVGLRGQKAASNLGTLFESGKFSKLADELNNAAGAAERMANIRMDTVNGSLLLLNSAVDAVKVKIFGLNNGPLKNTIDLITKWISANEDLIATKVGDFLANIIDNFEEIVRTGRQIAGVTVAYMGLVIALKLAAGASFLFTVVNVAFGLGLAIITGAIAAFAFIVAGLPKVLAAARLGMLLLNLAFFANPIGLVVAAIGIFIGLAALLFVAWDPVKQFFVELWDNIVGVVSGIGGAMKKFGSFFGFDTGQDAADPGQPGANMISPQDRTAAAISEQRTTNTAEVTLRDETGRAEVTAGTLGQGVTLQPSGAF